jgi:hypothetical protein
VRYAGREAIRSQSPQRTSTGGIGERRTGKAKTLKTQNFGLSIRLQPHVDLENEVGSGQGGGVPHQLDFQIHEAVAGVFYLNKRTA